MRATYKTRWNSQPPIPISCPSGLTLAAADHLRRVSLGDFMALSCCAHSSAAELFRWAAAIQVAGYFKPYRFLGKPTCYCQDRSLDIANICFIILKVYNGMFQEVTRISAMHVLHAIPALPVSDVAQRLPFYCTTLGFTLVHHDGGLAIVQRDAIEIHLWEADDQSWRNRPDAKPVLSGAESFLAGTASCRIAVAGVDELYRELAPHGIVHPNAPLTDQPRGTREFGVLDPDNNLITFFERQ